MSGLRQRLSAQWRRDDRGSILPLVPIVLIAVFVLGGLVVDGSRDLNDHANAQSYAEEAARAGASATDFATRTLTLDQPSATARVNAYCASIRVALGSVYQSCGMDESKGPGGFSDTTATCTGQASPIVVNVVVVLKFPTTLLGMIGVQTMTASGHASARPYEGLNAGSAC
jgi:Flp pilus assembly protein TadG